MSDLGEFDLKLQLLLKGIKVDLPSIHHIKYKFDRHLHNCRHFGAPSEIARIPQEIFIRHPKKGKKYCVGILNRHNSDFVLTAKNDELSITYKGNHLDFIIEPLLEPKFWSEKTSDGIEMYKILSVPGYNELNLWTWHDCGFHYQEKGCKFCTTTETSKAANTSTESGLLTAKTIMKQRANHLNFLDSDDYKKLKRRSIEAVEEALLNYRDGKFCAFTIIGGSLAGDTYDLGCEVAAQLLGDLRKDCPQLTRIPCVVNINPPKDHQKIELLKKSGADVVMFNLELWDKDAFNNICPGKSAYGREGYLNALSAAAKIFGKWNVWSNFVCGLEPMESQLEGFRTLLAMGVVPGANVFHRDPNVSIEFTPCTSFSSVKKFYRDAACLLRKEGARPFYSLTSRRSSLLWEAYES